VSGFLRDLFQPSTDQTSTYIHATATRPVVAFEIFGNSAPPISMGGVGAKPVPNTFAASFNASSESALDSQAVTPITLEAETMTTKTTGGLDGVGWNIWSDGYIEQSVTFPQSGLYTFTMYARGTPLGGIWPYMQLVIDNVPVSQITVPTTSYAPYSVIVNMAA